jgi:hypothetical protein
MNETNLLSEEDVKSVAASISQNLTPEEKQGVLKRYPAQQDQDQTASWHLVIEDVIYQIVNERK